MSEVLLATPKKPGHRWTPEQAKLAQVKSALARATRLPDLPEVESKPVNSERMALVREQIDLMRAQLLKKTLEANERANLVRALDLMLDRERELNGQPKAGNRRPAPERSARRSWSVEPAEPQPMPAPACGPDTATNSVLKPSEPPATPQDPQVAH